MTTSGYKLWVGRWGTIRRKNPKVNKKKEGKITDQNHT
jgi:hypothetical protein